MNSFSADIREEGDALVIELVGHIDEAATLERVELNSNKIILNLEKVSSINSCGIREWVKWIRKAQGKSKIIYKNCPRVIINQINMVAGFLPDNAEVESFYVPYYCNHSGAEKMILFTKGREFNGSSLTPPEGIKCDETGEAMEMDVIEAKYFKFLK